jgi:hypothetical protein
MTQRRSRREVKATADEVNLPAARRNGTARGLWIPLEAFKLSWKGA